MSEELKPPTPLEQAIAKHYGDSNVRLAAFLKVTPQAVGQWVKRGYLPIEQARKVHARHPRVSVKSLVDPEMVGVLCGGKR